MLNQIKAAEDRNATNIDQYNDDNMQINKIVIQSNNYTHGKIKNVGSILQYLDVTDQNMIDSHVLEHASCEQILYDFEFLGDRQL